MRLGLLWRPVAAADTWLRRFGEDGIGPGVDDFGDGMRVCGWVMALHLGVDAFEAAAIYIVRRGVADSPPLPARPRPIRGGWLDPGLLARLSSSLGEGEGRWRQTWCGDAILRMTVDGRTGAEAVASSIRGDASNSPIRPPLARLWPAPSALGAAGRWAGSVREELNQIAAPLLGCIVTGPVAACDLGGRTAAEVALSRLLPPTLQARADRTLVEGVGEPAGVLASAAARHAVRLEAGAATYLDTLPRLHVGATVRGLAAWLPLVPEAARFVDAGAVWPPSPQPLRGLRIGRGQNKLVLALRHEEFETVRQVDAPLAAAPERDVSVELHVSVRPAHGHARLDVRPQADDADAAAALVGRRVRVDWQTMRDARVTPQAWIDEQPVPFPPPLLRGASHARWPAALAAIRAYLATPSPARLTTAEARLKARDDQSPPSSGVALSEERADYESVTYAVGSEGLPPSGKPSPELSSFCDRLLLARKAGGVYDDAGLLRALQWTCCDEERLSGILRHALRRDGAACPTEVVSALGTCLHDPAEVPLLAQTLLKRLRGNYGGPNDWLKALARVLRYRPEAARELDSDLCLALVRGAHGVFSAELEQGNAKYLFRNSALLIVYLLRRRRYDPDFLNADDPLTTQCRESFTRAVVAAEQRRLQMIGGAIHLPTTLRTMIAYIDKRGPAVLHGQLSGFAD